MPSYSPMYPAWSDVPRYPGYAGRNFALAPFDPGDRFTSRVTVPVAPMNNPLMVGLQFGLLGAASGLGYTALRDTIEKSRRQRRIPGVSGVMSRSAKPMLIGATIGVALGAIAATKSNRALGYPARGVTKSAAWIPLALKGGGIALKSLFAALGVGGAARAGDRALKSFGEGDYRAGLGHSLQIPFNALLALPAVGMLGRGGKALHTLGGGALASKGLMSKTPGLSRAFISGGAGTAPAQVGEGASRTMRFLSRHPRIAHGFDAAGRLFAPLARPGQAIDATMARHLRGWRGWGAYMGPSAVGSYFLGTPSFPAAGPYGRAAHPGNIPMRRPLVATALRAAPPRPNYSMGYGVPRYW